MITFLHAAVLAAMISSDGVVLSGDGKTLIATVGDQCAVGLHGLPAMTLASKDGRSLVDYHFLRLLKKVADARPGNPSPSNVAEGIRAGLTEVFARFDDQDLKIGDIDVVVAGITNGKPSVWTVKAVLSSKMFPRPIIKRPVQLQPGRPYPLGIGFRRSEEEVEAAWPKRAPSTLTKHRQGFSLADLAAISGLMISMETEKNSEAKLPVRQVLMTVDGRQQKQDWSPPR